MIIEKVTVKDKDGKITKEEEWVNDPKRVLRFKINDKRVG